MNVLEQLLRGSDSGICQRLSPDCIVLNDIYGDRILDSVKKSDKGFEHIQIFIDHVVPSDCPETDEKQVKLRNFAKKYGVPFREAGGIAYSLLIEELLMPGQVVAGAGSHIGCCGALGCVAVSVKEEKLMQVIRENELSLTASGVKEIRLTGRLEKNADARWLAMQIQLMDIPINQVLVFSVDKNGFLSVDDRAALCGALGELGYPAVVVLPDDTVHQYLRERGRSVNPTELPFEADIELSLAACKPYLKEPGSNAILPLSKVKTQKIKAVFIGGCMGGNEEDIRRAAEFLKGKQVAKNMRVLVVPNTQRVYLKAVNEGWVDILEDAGAMLMNPHCSACWGKAQGHLLDDEIAVSTGYKNCPGCLGAEQAKVYITSVMTALNCAVSGRLEASL